MTERSRHMPNQRTKRPHRTNIVQRNTKSTYKQHTKHQPFGSSQAHIDIAPNGFASMIDTPGSNKVYTHTQIHTCTRIIICLCKDSLNPNRKQPQATKPHPLTYLSTYSIYIYVCMWYSRIHPTHQIHNVSQL